MRRRPRSTEGAYTITGAGVEESSAQSLGAAISKAQTIAVRVQRTLGVDSSTSLYVRKLGEEAAARIDVLPDRILTYAFSGSR